MSKAVYFDMDNTIADLYGVEDWLPKLRSENPSPYLDAMPMVDLNEFANNLKILKSAGYTIGIITWLSKFSSESYKTLVRKAKRDWLKKIEFKFDEVHMIAYGTPKHKVAKIKNAILVDDDLIVADQWRQAGGSWVNANDKRWLKILMGDDLYE
jgi:hypothetical protein